MMGNVGFTVWVSGDDGMMGAVFSDVFILQVIKYSFIFILFFSFILLLLLFDSYKDFVFFIFFPHFDNVFFVKQVIEWVIPLLLDTI